MPSSMSEHFELGAAAAKAGKSADACPYATGTKRREWLAGYFSAKPPLQEDPDEVPPDE